MQVILELGCLLSNRPLAEHVCLLAGCGLVYQLLNAQTITKNASWNAAADLLLLNRL
jgi:hypothetical protein